MASHVGIAGNLDTHSWKGFVLVGDCYDEIPSQFDSPIDAASKRTCNRPHRICKKGKDGSGRKQPAFVIETKHSERRIYHVLGLPPGKANNRKLTRSLNSP